MTLAGTVEGWRPSAIGRPGPVESAPNAGTAQPRPLRTSGAGKSVVAVTGEERREKTRLGHVWTSGSRHDGPKD